MSKAIVNATVSFSVARHERLGNSPWTVTSVVDGVPLTALVTEFERQEQFEPAGGYGGLIPAYCIHGPLDRYFLGEADPGSHEDRVGFYLLGCDCGEVGCWPLICRITTEDNVIIWHGFVQVHRRARDYSRFGPFVFDEQQYKHAVAELCAAYAAREMADRE